MQASVTVNGKTVRRSFTDADKKAAEMAALEWQSEKIKYDSAPNRQMLGEAIDKYIDSRRNILSPISIATYEKIKRLYFTDLQSRKLSNITKNMLQSEVNELSGKLSPKSVASARGLISAVIKHSMGETVTVMLPKKQRIIYATPDMKHR